MEIPRTGTNAVLEWLSPYVPDEAVLALLPRRRGGRRAEFSAAQMLRVLLLQMLTPARSGNLLCALLPEQRTWRQFAHLSNRWDLPNERQLHEFRQRLTPGVLRELNAGLLRCLMQTWPAGRCGVALIDATDLPAATNEYKKRPRRFLRAASRARRTDGQDRPRTLLHRLQKAHPAAVA